MRFSSICISWRSFRSSAPSGSSRSSTRGSVHERARERDALALAAGELHRLAAADVGEPHQLERLLARARRSSRGTPLTRSP